MFQVSTACTLHHTWLLYLVFKNLFKVDYGVGSFSKKKKDYGVGRKGELTSFAYFLAQKPIHTKAQ